MWLFSPPASFFLNFLFERNIYLFICISSAFLTFITVELHVLPQTEKMTINEFIGIMKFDTTPNLFSLQFYVVTTSDFVILYYLSLKIILQFKDFQT